MEKDNNVRKQKVASVLQGIASRFFTLNSSDWQLRAMVMVDHVFVAPDLKSAQVWISFSPHDHSVAPQLFEKVKMRLQDLQNFVFEQMEIRRVPKLSLYLSDPEKTFKVIDLFDKLGGDRKPSQSDTTDTDEQQSDTADDA